MTRIEADVIVDEYIDIPELEFEEISTEPSDSDIWIPGYWERDASDWTWVTGRWDKPPHKKARWVNGHWKRQEDKWHWHRGSWAIDNYDGYIVDEYIDIPVTLNEDMTTRPSKKNHWVSGCWDWDGYWSWEPGYWTIKGDPNAEWVIGHWEPYAADGWRWISGHWSIRH